MNMKIIDPCTGKIVGEMSGGNATFADICKLALGTKNSNIINELGEETSLMFFNRILTECIERRDNLREDLYLDDTYAIQIVVLDSIISQISDMLDYLDSKEE